MRQDLNYFLKKAANMDFVMLLVVVLLMSIGTIMVFSSSSLLSMERHGLSTHYLFRHLFWMGLGLLIMPIAFFFQVRLLNKMALFLLGGVLALLLLTLLSPLGVQVNHATRWLNLGLLSLQPAELAKPVVLIYVASYLSRKEDRLGSFFSGLLPLLLMICVVVALILKQPDFGSTVVILTCVGIMLFAAGIKWSYLMGLLLAFMVSCAAIIQVASYRKQRLLTFLNPWEDPSGSGFQILQSLLAFERGGIYGQGLGDGSQKLLYLPEAHTDFVFSVVAEELGLVGTFLIIALFAILVVQGLRLSLRLKDTFASQLAIGLTSLLGFQAFLNIAVVMAMVPTKGLTLPFVSYGGSSLLSSMVCVALLLSLSASVGMAGSMARRVAI